MLHLHHHSSSVSPHRAICPPTRLACSCICNKANSRTTALQSTNNAKLLLPWGWSSTRRRITTVASGQSVPGYTPDDGDQCLETDNISFATVKDAVINLNSVGVRSELILLALPAVLGQAIDPMAQLMETAYIGRLGALELASAGIGISIFNIVSKIFNIPLLSIATSFVAEDISRSATKHPSSGKLELTSVSSALILAAGIGIMEALALFLGSGLFLKLMGVSPVSPMYRPAKLFLSLRALGAPANVIMLAVQGIFRGFKDTKTPVFYIGLGNLSAVALLPLLIYGFQLGITGAAISTVVSQYIITVLLLRSLSKKAVLLPPGIDQLEFGGYLKSGGMLLGRTLSILLTMTIGTSMAARQGPTAMAAHQICLQVWLAVSLLADALAVSAQALIASSYAILDYKRVQKIAMFALQIGVFSGLALAIGLYASFGNIARLFTSDPEVLMVVKSCALFVCASQPINALAFIFDGLHYGVSDFDYVAQATIVVGVMSSLVLLWAPSVFGLAGVWAGLTTLMGLRMAAGVLSCAVSLEEKITGSCIYSIDICNPRRLILMCLRRFINVDFDARWTNDGQFGHSDQIRVIEVPPNECGVRLAAAGYGVFRMDYEVHGKSMGARCYIRSFRRLVDDCSHFFKSICELGEYRGKSRFLYGESMGGAVALLLHRKDPAFWDGAVLVAPMCKISEKVKRHPVVITLLTQVEDVIPKWKIVPTKQDVIDAAFKDPVKREKIRRNKLIYQDKPRLKTALEMLRTSMYIEDSLSQVKLPFFVLHGEADTVTDPEVSRALYERAARADKTIKLYPGMWHGLTAGEPDENVEAIFSDIVSWLNQRSRSWTMDDRFRKLVPAPAKFIDGDDAIDGKAQTQGRPRRRRPGLLCGLAGRTHHHAEM